MESASSPSGARSSLRPPLGRAPGLHRAGSHRWLDDAGKDVRDPATLARLAKLAIPPAWQHVWATASEHDAVQATGVDGRGRTQYRYSLAAGDRAALNKFEHMLQFAARLPDLRSNVERDIQRHRPMGGYESSLTSTVAAVVRLLDRGLFRVGNARYLRDNHTYGLTTLTRSQVTVRAHRLTFSYVGKEHLQHVTTVEDAVASRAVTRILAQGRAADDDLFAVDGPHGRHRIDSVDVNAYLHRHTGAPRPRRCSVRGGPR